jgi:hypothetical protein
VARRHRAGGSEVLLEKPTLGIKPPRIEGPVRALERHRQLPMLAGSRLGYRGRDEQLDITVHPPSQPKPWRQAGHRVSRQILRRRHAKCKLHPLPRSTRQAFDLPLHQQRHALQGVGQPLLQTLDGAQRGAAVRHQSYCDGQERQLGPQSRPATQTPPLPIGTPGAWLPWFTWAPPAALSPPGPDGPDGPDCPDSPKRAQAQAQAQGQAQSQHRPQHRRAGQARPRGQQGHPHHPSPHRRDPAGDPPVRHI